MILLKELQKLSKLSQERGSPVFSDEECAQMSKVIDNTMHAQASVGKTKCKIDFEELCDVVFPNRAKRRSELIKFVLQDYIKAGYSVVLEDAASFLAHDPSLGLQPLSVPLSFTISWDPSKVA